ncbi:helix-turn-helix transcriptional regulator [Leisingera aquaemixtae]|uniref:Helix-turn-helix transcriptional regulator n=2 Tax=Leisingera aquaemixtae TaxID=1396826 RepID=A0ABY5WL03_9RHOB|nr:helix-turn-helix transcriptional regulator [Leisingera aquaemixtae]UWQ42089.1 helix-turn-helix transcriptional regulator [Leisingera aquaemixtae]
MDLYERFMSAGTSADRWRIANEVMASLGAIALNVAEVEIKTRRLLWLRSSMTRAFLAEYAQQKFYEVDQFVSGIGLPFYPSLHVTGTLERATAPSQRHLDFNWTTWDMGYTLGYAMRFAGACPGTSKTVVFCAGETASEFTAEQFEKIRQAGTAVAAFIGAPGFGEEYPAFPAQDRGSALSSREKQMLALLAAGYLNTRIAHELGIAEVTVRKTLLSARRKLGAKTREEALAIAVRSGLLDF